jgi:CO/xanthine dehydrogenase FAD-binding subunit
VAFGLGGGAEVPTAFPELAARLIGTRMDDATLQDVANEAARQLAPGGDLHASAAYRMHLAATLAARVLRDAYTRAISRA